MYKADEKIKPWEKHELLEQAVLRDSPNEVSRLIKSLGNVEFTARALGFACRFRGIDMVKVLVENGANFKYDYDRLKQIYRKADRNISVYSPNENYSLALTEFLNIGYLRNVYNEGKNRCDLLFLNNRLMILDYLFKNADKAGFKPDEFMFFAILADEQEMISFLKNKGVKISEKWAKIAAEGGTSDDWYDYGIILKLISDDRFIPVLNMLIEEIGQVVESNKLHFTDWFWYLHEERFQKPQFFDFLLANFNQKKMNKGKLMKKFIDLDNVSCIEIAANYGWIKQTKKRDEMIQYATANKKPECTAFLLDFKNRTADLNAERERAEKKAERELNANPYSLSSLKKSWSFNKKKDGTLIITGYKGSSTVIEVPQKIGDDRVTEIGDWAFSPYASRIKEPTRQFRRTIRKIILPEGLKKIGESAFCELKALESINIPKSVRSIGEYAFRDCYMLKSITVPEGVTDIGDNAFSMLDDKGELEYVELPSTLKIFKKDCRWWRPYLFHSANSPKLVIAVPHAPHVEEFCEHNKIKFVYKENK